MKVILQQDVKGSGRQGDVVDVSDGYARNYLFPRKLAVPADTSRLNSLRRHQEAQAHRAATAEDRARDEAARIDGKSVRVAVRAGENGKLFGSVSTREVADALKRQLGFTFDRKKITLDEHIKQLGEYEAQLRLYAGVTATIKVLVTAEE
ncbi:MAG: 50S ribosomal protein L9 [Christensenellales bacterium]|jgi:large subunit ribosomal protein L9